jgi:hypothetical protein
LASLPSTGTGKKRGTATQTAPNQTAGPLAVSPHEKLTQNETTKNIIIGRQFIRVSLENIQSRWEKRKKQYLIGVVVKTLL